MPPHKIGLLDNATFSNIEHQAIEFANETIAPWAARWEQAITWDLFTRADRETAFIEFMMAEAMDGTRFRAPSRREATQRLRIQAEVTP